MNGTDLTLWESMKQGAFVGGESVLKLADVMSRWDDAALDFFGADEESWLRWVAEGNNTRWSAITTYAQAEAGTDQERLAALAKAIEESDTPALFAWTNSTAERAKQGAVVAGEAIADAAVSGFRTLKWIAVGGVVILVCVAVIQTAGAVKAVAV